MIRNSAIIFLLIFIINSTVCAQARQYAQHQVIDAGNGMKIEILQCRGEGENEECDVIFYTEKRQQGKRQWEKLSKINELDQNAKPAKPAKISKTLSNKSINQKSKLPVKKAVVKDTSKIITNVADDKPVKKITDDSSIILKTADQNLKPIVHANASQVYTLEQCFQLALERNLAIKRAQNTISSNIIDHKTAQYNLLPSVSYNLGHYFSFGKNIDPVTNTFVNENFSGGYTAVGLQLQLFSGFSRLNAIKQSWYLIESAQAAMKKAQLELLTNITLIYARLLLNKDQLQIERSNIESTTKQIEVINEKIKVGRLTRYEEYAFDARLNTEKAALITTQNDSSIALQDLKHLLNINYKQAVDIAAIDTFTLSKIYSSYINTADFIDTILLHHPAIKQARMDELAAQSGLKIAKGNLYPSLSAGGNVVTNYNVDQTNNSGQKIPLTQQLNDNIGKNINISLHIPIFSQLQNSNLIKKEKLNISNAQINIQETENLIVTNTLQLINDFNSSRQKYSATQLAYNQNALSYNMYEEKYRLGQISSLELLTAKDILNTSASQYLQARLELFFRYKLVQLIKDQL